MVAWRKAGCPAARVRMVSNAPLQSATCMLRAFAGFEVAKTSLKSRNLAGKTPILRIHHRYL